MTASPAVDLGKQQQSSTSTSGGGGAAAAFFIPKSVITELYTSGISVGTANTITNPLGAYRRRRRARSRQLCCRVVGLARPGARARLRQGCPAKEPHISLPACVLAVPTDVVKVRLQLARNMTAAGVKPPGMVGVVAAAAGQPGTVVASWCKGYGVGKEGALPAPGGRLQHPEAPGTGAMRHVLLAMHAPMPHYRARLCVPRPPMLASPSAVP